MAWRRRSEETDPHLGPELPPAMRRQQFEAWLADVDAYHDQVIAKQRAEHGMSPADRMGAAARSPAT